MKTEISGGNVGVVRFSTVLRIVVGRNGADVDTPPTTESVASRTTAGVGKEKKSMIVNHDATVFFALEWDRLTSGLHLAYICCRN